MIEFHGFTSLIAGEKLLKRKMISCVDKPEPQEENGARYVPSSEPLDRAALSVVHVGSWGFIFSPGNYYLSFFPFEFYFIYICRIISNNSANEYSLYLYMSTKRFNLC